MEFAVAIVGAVASVALSKVVSVDANIRDDTTTKTNAILIGNKLRAIDAIITESYRKSRNFNLLQTVCIVQLKDLAYDIEDCIDRFVANKTTRSEFANQIAELLRRSIATEVQMKNDMEVAEGLLGTQQGAVVGAADVPTELQNLLNAPRKLEEQVWLLRRLDCLLYLCLFPPNHDVSTKSLMRRWLAEGLVQQEKSFPLLRMFIQFSIINCTQRSNNGKEKRCQPTEVMRQYISRENMSRNFIMLCNGAAQLPEDGAFMMDDADVGDARRLSVHPSANVQLDLPKDLSHTRTLAVFPAAAGGGAPATLASNEAVLDFSRYKVLRVLDLKECADLREKHLNDIIIKHPQLLMKYLSINLGSIDGITRAIGRLNQLETLDLSGSETVTVFKEVLLLPKLKHLLGKFQLSKFDTFIDTYIPRWAVTSDLRKFLSQNKSKLETLAGFVIGERPGFQQLMSLMHGLRKVKIWCKSNASRRNLSALSSAITEFIRDGPGQPDLTRSLSIDFEEFSGEFLKEISVPATSKLDSLKLRGNNGEFPLFVARLCAVKELCLCLTGLSWVVIRAGLSNVKGLEYLKLIEGNLGPIKIPSGDLKNIKRLSIECVPRLDIAIQADGLPNLLSLHILCQDLDATPGNSGIEITHMKELEEVVLHAQVAAGVRAKWQQAVNGHPPHPDKPLPVLLFTEGP